MPSWDRQFDALTRRKWLLALVVVAGACGGGESASPTTEPNPPVDQAPTIAAPLTFTGNGEHNTDPFRLTGGSYISKWKGTGDCFYGAALRLATGELGGQHDLGGGDGPGEGTQNLYGVAAGEYFVHMTSGTPGNCPWTLTLERR